MNVVGSKVFWRVLGAVAMGCAVTVTGAFGSVYQYDDGTSTDGGGNGWSPSAVLWMHGFDVQPGFDQIVSVSTAWGSPSFAGYNSPPAGTPAFVGVWDDPNDDGHPGDAVLLEMVATTIQNPDTDIFQTVALTSPVAVTGKFFIGAWVDNMTTDTGWNIYPAPLDFPKPSYGGEAWFLGSRTSAVIDPYDLTMNEQFSNQGDFFPGYYLLRADAVPEPASAVLVGLGAFAGLSRRRSPRSRGVRGVVGRSRLNKE